MPLPAQTFTTIDQLLTYINTFIIPNGNEEIVGTIHNNVENALANFIVSYTLNSAKVKIESTTGSIVSLSKPISYFTAVPTSIQWPDNVQNEYYIVNGTSSSIPLTAGYSYIDEYQDSKTSINANTVLHIAKALNGSWIVVSNPGVGFLPSQTNHAGDFLTTDGTSASWFSPCIPVVSSDFESDGVTYLNNNLLNKEFLLFLNDIPRFIYNEEEAPAQIEWEYESTGGFKILLTGFDANTQDVHLYLFLKGSST